MKALEEMLREKRGQLERLQIEVATLEAAIRRTRGEAEVDPSKRKARRSNVKILVLDLLKEAAEKGLNASIAVDMAAKKNERIERGTVSSLLSRLKNEGIVTYDNEVYRLAQFARPPQEEAETNKPQGPILAFQASKG